ncbi:hypothetical protein JEU11_15300 [Paraglaciecola chathamensis]|uniref:Uncharacterized protein n=1 Tax=Paraglaciecola chathamensis TaxID=368405 RepID=A0ABS0WH71_9ALTE|nr:hypothetical protein [Paraglaciecola chathamensis]MBJ2137825.1 hypothetical protein [Paraglaciecola chathamensis]
MPASCVLLGREEPSAQKCHQSTRAVSQQESSVNKSLQPESATSQQEQSA